MLKLYNYFAFSGLFLTFSFVAGKEIINCRSGRFQCANLGACIPYEYVCDGRSDCSDSSDETNCSQGRNCKIKSCSHFCLDSGSATCKCPEGFQLDNDQRTCKDIDECETTPTLCSQNCTNNPGSFECSCFEGFSENQDGSCKNDISGETKKPKLVCTAGKHPCDNGESCISMDFVCDGSVDCSDSSDEENCKYGKLCKLKQCDQSCVDTTNINGYYHGGYTLEQKVNAFSRCSCLQGYKLNSDSRSCDDIDECTSGTHNCTQICANTMGSFKCSCAEGYYYDSSDYVCKAAGKYPLLYIGALTDIIAHNLVRDRSYSFHISSGGSVESIVHDFRNKTVLWLESFPEGGSIVESNQLGDRKENVQLDYEFANPVGLDIDWLNDLIYICDAGNEEIIACRRPSGHCALVVKSEMSRPTSVILDPSRRKMYYLDQGISPGIYSSGMDGSNTTLLVDEHEIKSFALDKATNTLVYALKKGTSENIDAISLSSGRTWTIFSNATYREINSPITNVEVFEDTIYFSTLSTDPKVWSFPKDSRKNVRPKVELTLHQESKILTMAIEHQILAPLDTINPCASSNCLNMCLLSPHDGYQCIDYIMRASEEIAKNDTEVLDPLTKKPKEILK